MLEVLFTRFRGHCISRDRNESQNSNERVARHYNWTAENGSDLHRSGKDITAEKRSLPTMKLLTEGNAKRCKINTLATSLQFRHWEGVTGHE